MDKEGKVNRYCCKMVRLLTLKILSKCCVSDHIGRLCVKGTKTLRVLRRLS